MTPFSKIKLTVQAPARHRFSNNELLTTDTELIAIAAPAMTGLSNPIAAKRYAQHVVDEGKEKILADFPQRRARERDGVSNTHQVVTHEGYVGGFNRHVRARADGKTHIGRGQVPVHR